MYLSNVYDNHVFILPCTSFTEQNLMRNNRLKLVRLQVLLHARIVSFVSDVIEDVIVTQQQALKNYRQFAGERSLIGCWEVLPSTAHAQQWRGVYLQQLFNAVCVCQVGS